jgi:hypothetical protein
MHATPEIGQFPLQQLLQQVMVRWAASPNQLPPFLSTEPFAWREIEPLDGEWREIEHEPLGGWGRGASAPVTRSRLGPPAPRAR